MQIIEIPKYKELSVKEIWPKVKDIESLKPYFPDLKVNEYPDREFMWTILSILKPKTNNILIENSKENRGVENKEDKEDLIKIAQNIFKINENINPESKLDINFKILILLEQEWESCILPQKIVQTPEIQKSAK